MAIDMPKSMPCRSARACSARRLPPGSPTQARRSAHGHLHDVFRWPGEDQMKTPKPADAPRTFVPAPRPPTSFDEDAIASRAWRDTFAALYRSRMSCSADHAQAVACLVQPSLGTLD